MNECQKIAEILEKISHIENLIEKIWFLYYSQQYKKEDLINELQILYEVLSAMQQDTSIEELIKNGEKLLKKRRKKNPNDVFFIKSLRYRNNNGLSYQQYLDLLQLKINFFEKLQHEEISSENLVTFFSQSTKITYKGENIYSDFLRNYSIKKEILQKIRNNTQTFLQKNYKKLSETLQKNYKKLPLKKDSEIINQQKFISSICERNDLNALERNFCLQKINFSFGYDNENICHTINFFAHNAGSLIVQKTLNKNTINFRAEKIILLKNIYAFLLQFHLCRSEEFAEYVVNFWQEKLKISKKTFNPKNLHRTMQSFCNEGKQIYFDELSFLQDISQNVQIEYELMHKKSLEKTSCKKDIKSKKILDSTAWINGNFFQNHFTLYSMICAHKIMQDILQDETRKILVGISNGDLQPIYAYIEKNINNNELYNIEKKDYEKYFEYLKNKIS